MMISPEHSNTKPAVTEGENFPEHEQENKPDSKKKGRKRLLKPVLIAGVIFLSIILSIGGLCFKRYVELASGRTNFLFLGLAGGQHSGSDLTDSIIFLSIDNKTGDTLVLSLPRDIWIKPLRTKLNSVYHYQGIGGSRKAVEEITGQSVDHYLVVDFNIFVRAVDILGGVEVNVQNTFDDYRYPIAGKEDDLCDGDPDLACRYEHIHFSKGSQLMDGNTALKYVRSRFAEGEEGTDFARSQRQQQVMLAIKERVLSPKTIFNLRIMKKLFELARVGIETDLGREDVVQLLGLLAVFNQENLKTSVLNDGYLVNPPPSEEKYDSQWVLVPAGGNWEQVHEYLSHQL